MKFTKIFIGFLLFISLVSCSSDDEVSAIQPSASLIEMEAEGGETEVSFTSGDWYIAEVVNQNGDIKIHGNTYTPEGNIIKENSVLSMEDQGKLEAHWSNKGFTISRDTPSSLRIELKENSTGEPFSFILLLQSGEKFKEIRIIQKESQGYTFESIEFSLKEDDGDSLFVKRDHSYEFSIPEPLPFEFAPYGGIDVQNRSQFQSMEEDAFVWLENDSVLVEIPAGSYQGELYFTGEKRRYSNELSINPHGFEEMGKVTIPAGESSFSVEQEWRKRQVSYKLSLINNRTGEEKIIDGKWIEIAPTGTYSVHWKD